MIHHSDAGSQWPPGVIPTCASHPRRATNQRTLPGSAHETEWMARRVQAV